MNTEKSNLHVLNPVKGQEESPTEASTRRNTGRDMSKVAVIVSLLSVVLLVIFFFGINRNLAGVTEELSSLRGLRQDVTTLDAKVGKLEAVPGHLKYSLVSEMEMQSVLLARMIDDPGQMERLQAIRAQLLQLKEELVKE
ncbi:hypothetical protein [Salidesulfovibrio onnuriiensis]|uniref:hypothetical protein n=1 Tax=Salidesulfovibrio onnuriiensis TaxID=2583823 RepID=UPI0011C7E593|nr:hypothetical protein [Salidesulfovibrio onnuriiensis]